MLSDVQPFENHYKAYWEGLKTPLIELSNCQVVCTHGPTAWLNGVISQNFKGEELQEKVQEVVKYFDQTPFSWWVPVAQEPALLANSLSNYGLSSLGERKGMVLDLNSLEKIEIPQLLTVEEVAREKEMEDMINVLLDVYHESKETGAFAQRLFWEAISPNKVMHFLGKENEKPVTAGSLFIDGEIARIFHVGTLKEARNKSYGSSLMYMMLEKAKILGCRLSVLVSTEMGIGLYKRLGYVEKNDYRHYMKI